MAVTTGKQKDAEAGDNYDAVARAEAMLAYYEERLNVEGLRSEFNEKMTGKMDRAKAPLKKFGIKIADLEDGFRKYKLKDASENADKAEDRDRAQRNLEIAVAVQAEATAAVLGQAQLNFDEILERGRSARTAEAEANKKGTATESTPATGTKH